MSDISSRLKMLRLSRNLTQKQVAEAIGASESGVQNYELGTRKPTFEMIIKLARFFDVSADYLLGLGIYANQDIILECREDLEAYAGLYIPKEHASLLTELDSFDFLETLDLIFSNIDYSLDPDTKKPHFYVTPRFPMPPE